MCKILKIINIQFLCLCVSFSVNSSEIIVNNTKNSISNSQAGTIVRHEPDNEIPYTWFTYVPKSITKQEYSYILVPSVVNWPVGDYNGIIENTIDLVNMNIEVAESEKYILLAPCVPRNEIYTGSFDKLCFSDETNSLEQRPDLKLNAMIDRFNRKLKDDGFNVHEKIFIEGFSVGGMFAQRYTLLNPERIIAISAGQCGGSLVLPEKEYSEGTITKKMNWPIGINDFVSLTGDEFNQATYQDIPQYIYIGSVDTTNSHAEFEPEIDFLNEAFGNTDPIRIQNQCQYMVEKGYNVTFKMYEGVGHDHLYWKMKPDRLNFFERYKLNNAPVFDYIDDKSVLENEEISFFVHAKDYDNDDVIYTCDDLPFNSSFNTETGLFEWQPAYNQSGQYNLLFVVTDDEQDALSDSIEIAISVENVLMPPENVIVEDRKADHGHCLKLTWDLSPDDEYISHYFIYRSRASEPTEPLSIDLFDTIELLIEAEECQTIHIGTVDAGVNTFDDLCVPLDNVNYYYWLAAVSSDGVVSKISSISDVLTGVENNKLTDVFRLFGNYPNPFNPSTSIYFQLPDECHVRLQIYSISGQLIDTLLDNMLTAGNHEIHWQPNGLSTGLYIYTVEAKDKRQKGKMVFVK